MILNRLGVLALVLTMGFVSGCGPQGEEGNGAIVESSTDDFDYFAEQFADLKILRYTIPGFEELDLKTKKLCYYLYEAAHSGREIIADQNNKHNLTIRRTLENILTTYSGDKAEAGYDEFNTYLKQVWFANGIHHHYSTKKHTPKFSREYFKTLVAGSDQEGFPLSEGQTVDELVEQLTEIIFDASVDAKRVNLDPEADPVAESANNFYEGVNIDQVREFYAAMKVEGDETPISYGLNSKVIMGENGLEERVWKVGGMYTEAIEQIVFWLKKASGVSENAKQKKALDLLIEYYETGDLKKFDEYSIAWVADTDSRVDVVNGFIEVYGDATGYRGAYESVVSIKDLEATKRIKAISDEAQWFEDHSSIMAEHKKEEVKGISAKVITIITESGDASPSTPIGINLPNANWIRSNHGSKSVNLGNVVYAYNQSSKSGGLLEEFAFSEEEIERTKKHAALAGDLHTDMHEVIGHASGKINPGIGSPKETLKSYASTLEEARADLVALYYLLNNKLVDIGVMTTTDVGKAEYDGYIRNGLIQQLVRLELGDNLEEAHMRNRQLVAGWVLEKGREHSWWNFWEEDAIEFVKRDGKTYVTVRDYTRLQELFGELLKEIQRIKSEGDYEAGKNLVENYGVKVDPVLHAEVLERFKKLNVAAYSGFINPILEPVMKDGEIVDIKVTHTESFTTQ
ncbi:MAG: dihydrofolate reductase, partial [Flavobacteriales bacterium]|nr:dihydrofolate reductase [Flavobacteriales bacterium]